MIDLSKIADIALVMLDTSVGFEMETFEFLCLLKNHGFTSVMGVLTHMDEFRVNKSLNKLKKQIKKRFLKEVTDKAKLFYLYGIKNGLYMKMQMHNLARYLKVIKPTVPGFRQNHPYVLADRFDVTFFNSSTTNDPEEDVMVSFFGYVRGNNLNKNSLMHIMGLGDYNIDFAVLNDDPCPVETVSIKGKKKRTLKQKEKTLYAPYCNINSLEYDRNAGYISIPDKFVTFTKGIGENSKVLLDDGVRIIRELQDMKKSKVIDQQINNNELEIFEGMDYEEKEEKKSVKVRRTLNITEQENNSKPVSNKIEDIIKEYDFTNKPQYYQSNPSDDILKSIYDYSTNDEEEGNEYEDNYKFTKDTHEHDINFLIKNAKKRFITGASFADEGAENLDQSDDEESETNKKDRKEDYKGKGGKDLPTSEDATETVYENKTADEQAEIQSKIRKDMRPFINEEFGLFEKGSYVRLDIKRIKRKYVDHFKIEYPIVLCTTNIQENSMGFIKIKFSKHIWHPKIMKTNDPIILSIGWRKFQTTPIYCVEDDNQRLRMIKYTPKFTSCIAVAYGPFLPINVAVVGIQNYSSDAASSQHFRICGTGDLLEVNHNFEIMKKLKLIGEPMEIFKKTAFIKGMFNSNVK
jgi:ribosome biogenesis protein BMS1